MMDARSLLNLFKDAYGEGRWWSDDQFTVMFQSVLVQNTSWSSVENVPVPCVHDVLSMSQEDLERIVRPCGFFHAKARTVRALAEWYASYGFDCEAVKAMPVRLLKKQLLSIRGIGPESADDILVYAFHKPLMIVDAYTRRLLERMGYVFTCDDGIRSWACASLGDDAEAYGHLHWYVLDHCISYCRKKPACVACPVSHSCLRMGL